VIIAVSTVYGVVAVIAVKVVIPKVAENGINAEAAVVQRRVGVDLGLGLGQPLPPVQSRQAAEITRRVMHWATQFAEEQDLDSSLPLPARA
jgi:hypothetical protein